MGRNVVSPLSHTLPSDFAPISCHRLVSRKLKIGASQNCLIGFFVLFLGSFESLNQIEKMIFWSHCGHIFLNRDTTVNGCAGYLIENLIQSRYCGTRCYTQPLENYVISSYQPNKYTQQSTFISSRMLIVQPTVNSQPPRAVASTQSLL